MQSTTAAVPEKRMTALKMKKLEGNLKLRFAQIGFLASLLILWEVGARMGWISTFLFASPSKICNTILNKVLSGELFNDIWVTGKETVLGFIFGSVMGSFLGLLLWCSEFIAKFSKPYVAAIGSIPVMVLSPLVIIWFGTGIASKVAIVTFSCIFVSLSSAYEGAMQVDPDLLNLMRSFGATKFQIFCKVVVPSSMTWVVSGFKMNIGFAIVGAIVGEYISSDAGIGHMILMGSNSFHIHVTLAGLVTTMVFVFVLNIAVGSLEKVLLRWKK